VDLGSSKSALKTKSGANNPPGPSFMRELLIFSLAFCLATIAMAGELETASPTPVPRFKISGWIDSGITFNPASPQDNQNFGRFFDDRVNEPLLNQLVINFERALAPQPGEFDWAFKLQFMYGSDARFIHSLGLFSNTAATSIVQPDLVEAYLNLHFPIITEGGIDLIRHLGRGGNDRSAHQLLLFAYLHL